MHSRTVAFFLEEEPMEICEVILHADDDFESKFVQGSCSVAVDHDGVCPHAAVMAKRYQTTGILSAPIDAQTPTSIIRDAIDDPRLFRELIIHRGEVQVIADGTE